MGSPRRTSDMGAPRRAGATFALVTGLAALAFAQAPEEPTLPLVPIENPGALSGFADALSALAHDPSRRVRVLHYGDSNVAADIWTNEARVALQRRYGDGGSGFLLPPGHGSWHRGQVSLETEGTWRSRRRGFGRDFGPNDGLWGVAGVGIEAESPGARIRVDVPAAPIPRVFELHLLGRPRPGAIVLRVDQGEPIRVSTFEAEPGLILRRLELSPGAHRVVIRHAGGHPRVLGVVVERGSGVVYDVLGINGHRASAILHWNERLLRSELAQRRPNLVVLSYGGNEALDRSLPMATYETQLRRAVTRMRSLTPDASCLMVGPLATYPVHAARMQQVTDVQRRLAPELGCAFWDGSRLAGGHGNLGSWGRVPGLVSGDRLHLARHGYELVGARFAQALLAAVQHR